MKKTFTYNDIAFTLERSGEGWDIGRSLPDGGTACVATHVFAGLAAEEVDARAQALVRSIYPVGVRSVGPDVMHPHRIGDLKIVGPDVTHPNFIHWDKDSSSFPK